MSLLAGLGFILINVLVLALVGLVVWRVVKLIIDRANGTGVLEAEERSRRAIAKRVAKGELSVDDAERLLNAGPGA
ncbi:MAG: hypothetical protein AAGK04_05160 [Planctomycetota bacterium]